MRGIILALIAVIAASVAGARDVVGEIVYLEGRPEITRAGDIIVDTVEFGFPLENFDSVRTDATSLAELELHARTGIDATISISPDTIFSIDLTSFRSEQSGTIELITGSLSIAVRELIGISRLNVRTRNAIAGVRGTTFAVTTAVGGEVLVSADLGLIEVTDDAGSTLFAAPGEAVELNPERNVFRTIKYQGTVAEFRSRWLAERARTIRENAPGVFRYYGRRYLDERAEFVRAYADLMLERDIIDRWIEESRRGITGDDVSVLRDQTRIADPLLRARAAMSDFEDTLARLERLKTLVAETAAEIDLGRGDSAADLITRIELDVTVMRHRFAVVRHVLRMYSDRDLGEIQ